MGATANFNFALFQCFKRESEKCFIVHYSIHY